MIRVNQLKWTIRMSDGRFVKNHKDCNVCNDNSAFTTDLKLAYLFVDKDTAKFYLPPNGQLVPVIMSLIIPGKSDSDNVPSYEDLVKEAVGG